MVATTPTPERVEKARREGRFQQALELAKQLQKEQPSPAHLELLKAATLGRAEQLRDRGERESATQMLLDARRLDGADTAWLEALALSLARCGAIQQALALVPNLPDGPASTQLMASVADGGNGGRRGWP